MDPSLPRRLALERSPFAQVGAPFLLTPQLQQRCALLAHLVAHGGRPVLLIGDAGAGKTRLLTHFVATMQAPLRGALWRGTQQAALRDIVPALSHAFGMQVGEQSLHGLATALRVELTELGAAGQITVLCVDDADRLSRDVLAQLLELGEGEDGLLRLVLVGDQDLEARVMRARRSVEPSWLPRVDLPPLTARQVAEYLQLHLAAAGEAPFDAQACQALQQRSGGNPQRLEQLADAVLAEQSRPQPLLGARRWLPRAASRWLPGRLVGGALAVGVLVVVATGWALWPAPEPTPQPGLHTLALPSAPPGAAPAGADVGRGPEPTPTPPRLAPGGATPSANPPASPPVELAAPPVEVDTTAPSATGAAAAAVPPTPSSRPRPLPRPELAARTAPAVVTPELTATARPPGPRPPPPPRTRLDSDAGGGAAARTPAAAAPAPAPTPAPIASAPAPAPTPAPAAAAAPAPAGAPVRPPATPAGGFALQLAAFAEPAAAFAYLDRQGLTGDARVYSIDAEPGARLYAVLLGRFESRDAANLALAELPLRLRVAGPWPRPLAGLSPVAQPR